jgi:hypothetical protein
MVNIDISADEDTIAPEHPLYLEAEAGLRQILDQFQLSAAEIDEAVGSFHNFIAAPTDRFFKAIPKKNRYAWAVSHDNEQTHETVTERMNSTMKPTLSPFRLRMGPDVLLSRLTIERRGNAASPNRLTQSVQMTWRITQHQWLLFIFE